MRDLGTLSPKWDTSIRFLLWGSGNAVEGIEDTEKTQPPELTGSTHISTQRLGQHAQGLHGSAPVGVLELKGEMGTCPTPNPEAVSI